MSVSPAPALSLLDRRTSSCAVRGYPVKWAILTAVLALQLVYFTGVISSDDMSYLAPAVDARDGLMTFPVGMEDYDCHCFARFVYWKMVQGVMTLLPAYPWAMALPSMVATWVSLLVIYRIANAYWDRTTALVAMALGGVIPLSLCNASVSVPDPVAGALAWMGVGLVMPSLLGVGKSKGFPGWKGLLAGVLIAAGYTAKEIVALFIPALILFVLVARRKDRCAWRAVLMLCIGAASWLSFEAAILYRWTGDWLFHLHAVVISQRGYAAPPIAPTFEGYTRYLTHYLYWLVDPRQDFGFVGPLMLAGLVWAAWIRKPIMLMLAMVVSLPLIYLTLGTTDLADYNPVVHQPRYLVPLLPGLAILAGVMVVSLWRKVSKRERWLMVGVAIPMCLLTLLIPNRYAGRWYFAATFKATEQLVAQVVENEPSDVVLAGGLSANRLIGFDNWYELPEVVRLEAPFPASSEEWVARYPGQAVFLSSSDRKPPRKSRHENLTLYGPPMDALAAFPRAARVEPPDDRLRTIYAYLRGQPGPTRAKEAVEWVLIPDQLPSSNP